MPNPPNTLQRTVDTSIPEVRPTSAAAVGASGASATAGPTSAGPTRNERGSAHSGIETHSEVDTRWNGWAIIPGVIYWGIHASCLLVFFTGVTWANVALMLGTFWLRMFAITGGYHRYFAHRTYRTGRLFQFVLAFLGTSAVQKGPLWWAGLHRHHHRFSDEEEDVHSPRRGFWYSHQGWIEDPQWNRTPLELIPDFGRRPELRFLNHYHMIAPILLAVFCYAVGGFSGLVWGFAVSTTVLWHSTYTINSLAHVWGRRRFATSDTSRNNWVLALLTFGEGWHNNHHRYQASARNGFYWWEIDITYYVLLGLAKLGIVWDLRQPPASVLAEGMGRTVAEPRKAA